MLRSVGFGISDFKFERANVMRSCLLNALCVCAESRLLRHEGKIAVIRGMYMPGMSLAARMIAILYRLEKAELQT